MDSPFIYMLSDLNISLTKRLRTSGLEKEAKLSVWWTITTFLSTSFGIGFLSIPIATAYSGIYSFMGLCILVAMLKYQANYALVAIGQRLKTKNFPLLVARVLKKSRWAVVIHFLMFFNIFGIIVTYTIAIQQSLSACFSYMSVSFEKQFPSYLGYLISRA